MTSETNTLSLLSILSSLSVFLIIFPFPRSFSGEDGGIIDRRLEYDILRVSAQKPPRQGSQRPALRLRKEASLQLQGPDPLTRLQGKQKSIQLFTARV